MNTDNQDKQKDKLRYTSVGTGENFRLSISANNDDYGSFDIEIKRKHEDAISFTLTRSQMSALIGQATSVLHSTTSW